MWCWCFGLRDNFVLHLVRFWVLSRRDELHCCWEGRQESHYEASLKFLTSASFPDGFCHTALRLMLTLSGVLLGARVQSVWITYFHFSMHCNGSEAWQNIRFIFFVCSTLSFQRRDWIPTMLVNLQSRCSFSFCIFCTNCSANISKHTECSQNILIFVQNVHDKSC